MTLNTIREAKYSCFIHQKVMKLLLLLLGIIHSSNSQFSPTPLIQKQHSKPRSLHNDADEIPHFRMINRKQLTDCSPLNPHLRIHTDVISPLTDEQIVTVTVSGILHPSDKEWVAMISPSHSNVRNCPFNKIRYLETGDLSDLPLLCHYPVKAAYLKSDPDYLSCKKRECKEENATGKCLVTTCTASLKFHVINIRTNITFVLFGNGFQDPCFFKRSLTLDFANPNQPLYAHISSTDSTATSMRVTWISGSNSSQEVRYGNGKSDKSVVTTFTPHDMCGTPLQSPAQDFGWHDPGYIHSAVITGLLPSTRYSFKCGSNLVGWSDEIMFQTPPAGGSNELTFIAYGDMGKAPRDDTIEHFIQPGSMSVADAIAEDVASGNIDSIFHIGDISYATGFLVEWDYFLHMITPFASHVPYMTAIGNHERDYPASGSMYITTDSGGECGIPCETYFQMPTSAKDKPWYSIEQGPIHFTVISTEHDWKHNSEQVATFTNNFWQYKWMKSDMESVNRTRTPWLIFIGHRPMYSSDFLSFFTVDGNYAKHLEPILLKNKVDMVMCGHVHNYERTCAVYRGKCKAKPMKDENGVDTFNNTNYNAPIHVVMGMAGFSLARFSVFVQSWSIMRLTTFGYTRIHATKKELHLEFVSSKTRKVEDSFRIIKS